MFSERVTKGLSLQVGLVCVGISRSYQVMPRVWLDSLRLVVQDPGGIQVINFNRNRGSMVIVIVDLI